MNVNFVRCEEKGRSRTKLKFCFADIKQRISCNHTVVEVYVIFKLTHFQELELELRIWRLILKSKLNFRDACVIVSVLDSCRYITWKLSSRRGTYMLKLKSHVHYCQQTISSNTPAWATTIRVWYFCASANLYLNIKRATINDILRTKFNNFALRQQQKRQRS